MELVALAWSIRDSGNWLLRLNSHLPYLIRTHSNVIEYDQAEISQQKWPNLWPVREIQASL